MLNRILMLHIKKPLNFHLIKYQPPVPLREKWGRNVKRKKNVARLKALGTVWCASDGGLYSFCTLYHMTWLFVKCSQTAWGEFLRLEETFLLLRKVLSPLLWVEKMEMCGHGDERGNGWDVQVQGHLTQGSMGSQQCSCQALSLPFVVTSCLCSVASRPTLSWLLV